MDFYIRVLIWLHTVYVFSVTSSVVWVTWEQEVPLHWAQPWLCVLVWPQTFHLLRSLSALMVYPTSAVATYPVEDRAPVFIALWVLHYWYYRENMLGCRRKKYGNKGIMWWWVDMSFWVLFFLLRILRLASFPGPLPLYPRIVIVRDLWLMTWNG